MRVKIWGCRGSLAAPGPETVKYGGNTSCVEVRLADGSLVILDAGTGIRPFGLALGGELPPVIHLMLSHLHLDHLEGLGFFSPLWSPNVELHVWGPPSPLRSLEERIARYLSPPLFPIHLADIPSNPTFHNVPDEEWEIGSARITAQPVSHPGPTVGYRIEENDKVLAYIPDHEPALGVDLRTVSPDWVSGYSIAYGADYLLHDAQYSEEEYPEKVGWGHSSTDHVTAFASISKVRNLVMFHHDPLHSDAYLEGMVERAQELWGEDGTAPVLAHEGLTIDLD